MSLHSPHQHKLMAASGTSKLKALLGSAAQEETNVGHLHTLGALSISRSKPFAIETHKTAINVNLG